MVFKHNEQTFAVNELDQLSYEPWRQLEVGGELASFPELSPLRPEKLSTLDGRQESLDNIHLENAPVALGRSSPVVCGGSVNLSDGLGNTNEVVLLEHSKRPLIEDEDCSLASKRPKQLEPNVQLGSPVLAYDSEGSPSAYGAEEEDVHLDPNFMTNSCPFYFEGDLRASVLNQSREAYSTCLDYYPRKPVAIGPNHQAIIPEWRSNDLKNCPGNAEDSTSATTVGTSSSPDNLKSEEGKMAGACVIPMPDAAILISSAGIVQKKLECSCPDEGSIRCVRQHVTEVRESLEKFLGHGRFADLGFCDMGEIVAERWTEEEEHLFQEVVLSNPASLGKNFWDYLPLAFPSRDSKEFVSYYFNVFMLRKRAEQNRFDPLNIDSDNDEWQESDDGEYAMEEEDDSAVESLADQEEDGNCEDNAEQVHVDDETEYEKPEEYAVIKDNDERISATLACPNTQNCVDEHAVRDDSCTSFESQHNGVDGGSLDGFTEGHKDLPRNDSLSAIVDHGFLEGQCGSKAWDMSYTHGGHKEEFLSTCNVIEEVFGKEGWKNNTVNNHGFSQS